MQESKRADSVGRTHPAVGGRGGGGSLLRRRAAILVKVARKLRLLQEGR